MTAPPELLNEAIDYVRDHDMILATSQTDRLFTASLQYRMDDTLYQTRGAGPTQAEAIVQAYLSWRNYWRKSREPYRPSGKAVPR